MRNDVENKLKDLVVKNSRIKTAYENINDGSDIINDLGYDSALTLQLILDIEREFDMAFDDEYLSLEGLENFCDLKNYIIGKLGG